MRTFVNTVTIPLSSAVSDPIPMKGAQDVTLFVPLVTSGTWVVQGAWETTSASFWPLQNPAPNSGTVAPVIAAGSLAVQLTNVSAPYVRLVGSTSQASLRVIGASYRMWS